MCLEGSNEEKRECNRKRRFCKEIGESCLRGAFGNPIGVSMCDLLSTWSRLYGLYCSRTPRKNEEEDVLGVKQMLDICLEEAAG